MNRLSGLLLLLCLFSVELSAEPFRILMAGSREVSLAGSGDTPIPLTFVSSVAINLEGDIRFFRGIQIDLTAPQAFLGYRGSLAVVIYSDLNSIPPPGAADVEARQLSFEPLPDKIQNTWQIPIKTGHGLKSSPYIIIPTGIVAPSSFPILFRLMPVIKGISSEMENMVFHLSVKPIFSDEGAVKMSFKYPDQLQGRPIIVLIDEAVVENPAEERLLKEGEHNLVILSDDYRNQSRRFVVERAKVLDLLIELQDPTPLITFEYPENARIFLDNVPVSRPQTPQAVDPGQHEVRFQISDYSITRPVTIKKGKTYTVRLSVDMDIAEND